MIDLSLLPSANEIPFSAAFEGGRAADREELVYNVERVGWSVARGEG